jgi:hypothetical protein
MPDRRFSTIRYMAGACAAILLTATGLLSATAASVPAAPAAQTQPAAGACDTPQHHQFDFWVGDWQVFEAKSNQLVGYDRVEKHSHGCIVQQNLTMVTDLYRGPGVGYRMSGISVNRFDGASWLELWADDTWGAIALRGTLDAHGSMVLTTLTPSRNRDLRLVWERRSDGSVRTLQYVAPAGSGKWELFGDLIYRPNR